jgi:hypothetical protein
VLSLENEETSVFLSPCYSQRVENLWAPDVVAACD